MVEQFLRQEMMVLRRRGVSLLPKYYLPVGRQSVKETQIDITRDDTNSQMEELWVKESDDSLEFGQRTLKWLKDFRDFVREISDDRWAIRVSGIKNADLGTYTVIRGPFPNDFPRGTCSYSRCLELLFYARRDRKEGVTK